jgi:hypothetical protein
VKAAKVSARGLRRRDLLAVMLAPAAVATAALAQSRPQTVKTRPVSTVHFRIDAPEKDWRLLPGGINTLGALSHKDGAAVIVIEHEMLQIALKPEEVDGTFIEIEAATIKERQITGTGFTSRVDTRAHRAVIDFQRRSPGGAEQVRVIVLVNGKHLYRLVCVAPAKQFARFEPVFQTVAASFTPLDPTA